MGQVAAKVAKLSFKEQLSRPDVQAALRREPKATLEAIFRTAHLAIESAFWAHYEEQGWVVSRATEGYLVRSKTRGGAPMCIHGGSTATVLIVLDGRRLIVSNVGDSTAIVVGLGTAGTLNPVDTWSPMPGATAGGGGAAGAAAGSGAAVSPMLGGLAGPSGTVASGAASMPGVAVAIGIAPGAPPASTSSAGPAAPLTMPLASIPPIPAEVQSSYMELSADHSPESHTEFSRMHRFRPHTTATHHPELLFVYDTLSASKLACPPIFDVDPRSGTTSKTERGSYYKNVRCEWATLVATPPHAPYQDALAFTRSLGDLHLQTYGVSHTPETWWMDLVVDGGPVVPYPMGIVLSSDGIWDNWKFEEVAAFMLTPERVSETARSGSAVAAATDIMAANLERARTNFGSSADNMTAIALYLFPRFAAAGAGGGSGASAAAAGGGAGRR